MFETWVIKRQEQNAAGRFASPFEFADVVLTTWFTMFLLSENL